MEPSGPQPNLNWFMYCFVPCCENTTSTTPEKIFIQVPTDIIKRKNWCDAVGYDKNKKLKKTSYCCEDHLDLKNDLRNYAEWKQFGGRKMLKEGVVPRFNLNLDEDDGSDIPSHLRVPQPQAKFYESKHVQAKPGTANKWSQTSFENKDKASLAVTKSCSVCGGCNSNKDK